MVVEDLGHAGVKHLYLGVFPCLLVVGVCVQIVNLGDKEIMKIHACNTLIGRKVHKRWDSKSDLGWIEIQMLKLWVRMGGGGVGVGAGTCRGLPPCGHSVRSKILRLSLLH